MDLLIRDAQLDDAEAILAILNPIIEVGAANKAFFFVSRWSVAAQLCR